MEGRVKASPSDFAEVVDILEADCFLRPGAEELVKSYCEWEHGCGLSLVSSFLWILKSGPARILTFPIQATHCTNKVSYAIVRLGTSLNYIILAHWQPKKAYVERPIVRWD